ncbi:hypothetical protein JCM1841_003307 [Sporobolomyces salmonicolor]
MRSTTAALALALSAASSVHAFAGTYPVVAWSSDKLESLSLLSSGASSSTPFQPESSQQTFASSSSGTADLCSLSSLLVVSVPGLHYSDLSLLPPSDASPVGIKSALSHATSSSNTFIQPYTPAMSISQPTRLLRRFERECGAVVESESEKNLWAGEKGKTIRVVQVEGLEGWELVGPQAKEGRKAVMQQLDSAVSSHLISLPAPYAVILTSMPRSFSAPRPLKGKEPCHHAQKISKRQALAPETDDEFVEELLEEIAQEEAAEAAFDKMVEEMATLEAVAEEKDAPSSTELGVMDVVEEPVEPSEAEYAAAVDPYTQGEWDGETLDVSPWAGSGEASPFYQQEGNGTSIFTPKEGSGLLHRYVFFTPALVFAFLVTLLVLIPTVLIGVQALTSIETSYGLETKMKGSTGIDPSKQ